MLGRKSLAQQDTSHRLRRFQQRLIRQLVTPSLRTIDQFHEIGGANQVAAEWLSQSRNPT
jgi:hypothetical protein